MKFPIYAPLDRWKLATEREGIRRRGRDDGRWRKVEGRDGVYTDEWGRGPGREETEEHGEWATEKVIDRGGDRRVNREDRK